MNESKLQLLFSLTGVLFFFFFAFLGQGTEPLLANSTLPPQPVSYSLVDAISSPASSMTGTKKIRMACYSKGGQCLKDSDCCSGHCVKHRNHCCVCSPTSAEVPLGR